MDRPVARLFLQENGASATVYNGFRQTLSFDSFFCKTARTLQFTEGLDRLGCSTLISVKRRAHNCYCGLGQTLLLDSSVERRAHHNLLRVWTDICCSDRPLCSSLSPVKRCAQTTVYSGFGQTLSFDSFLCKTAHAQQFTPR